MLHGGRLLNLVNQINRASAIEKTDLNSIPGWIKPTTIKIDIYSFCA